MIYCILCGKSWVGSRSYISIDQTQQEVAAVLAMCAFTKYRPPFVASFPKHYSSTRRIHKYTKTLMLCFKSNTNGTNCHKCRDRCFLQIYVIVLWHQQYHQYSKLQYRHKTFHEVHNHIISITPYTLLCGFSPIFSNHSGLYYFILLKNKQKTRSKDRKNKIYIIQ